MRAPNVGGSSPLTRGKRGLLVGKLAHGGLIPAHAGKTWPGLTAPANPWAHPRSRGENPTASMANPHPTGLIPAHAGKTRSALSSVFRAGAHPRSRGENVGLAGLRRVAYGSSPLTRGKLATSRELSCGDRLIPAHAGKTSSPTLTPSRVTAHPRSRGENIDMALSEYEGRGSSPLTRGKLNFRQGQISALGLIPAHAGKTGRRARG